MFGKNVKDHMSEEAYVKMLENKRKAMVGRKDMTCDGVHCKKVKPQDFDKYLSKGYWFKDKDFKYPKN